MGAIHKLLNVALPLLSVILLSILVPPFLFFRLLVYVRNCVCSEDVASKVVLITGAATGIGEQLAYEYGRRGALLSLVDMREDDLVAVADKALSLGSPRVNTIAADVSKPEDCNRFVRETLIHFGKLDHLVNNAGIGGRPIAAEDCRDISEFSPVIDVNFWGAVYGTLYAIPHLKKRKGRIIVIASACGWFPLPRLSIYNASKAAVINFFETLRVELGSAIGITIVTPGFVKTNLLIRAIHEEPSLGRLPMLSACECAKAIVKGACRGDMYVTDPSWIKMLYPWKMLLPQPVDWATRLLFGPFPSASIKKPELKAE